MSEDTDDAEKTEEPSQYRIDEYRKQGQVALSRELISVLVLAGCFLTLSVSVVYLYETMGEFITWLYNLTPAEAYKKETLSMIGSKAVMVGFKCAGPVFLVSICIGVFGTVSQVGFLYATDALSLKWDRIDPVAGFGRLFTLRSLVTAFKSFLKFLFILAIVYGVMRKEIHHMVSLYQMEAAQSFIFAKITLVKLGFMVLLGLAVIAVGDFAYEKLAYRKKLMMTKEEAKRELKEKEGNPEIKQRIRTIQREMAQKRMMEKVPRADVIVTNPTHISIALKYDSKNMVSPEVIAKGADHIALKIREIAKANNIPLVENVPLARALYKTVKVDSPVPRTLYKAVAEVLAFVYRMKKKQKALG